MNQNNKFLNLQEVIKKLYCDLDQIFKKRDLINGNLDNYCRLPYEVVISFPSSMGERGFKASLYYKEMPEEKEFYNDVLKELKNWIKKDNFLTAGIYTPTAYEEQTIKIIRKVLRENKLLK